MTLVIYGSARSRTMRVLWAAAELELDYQHVPLEWDDPRLKSPEFLRLNPAGTIPVIVDDGFALSESLAINLFLAKKHGSGRSQAIYPDTPEDEASAWRWSLWVQAHIEPFLQRDRRLADLRQAMGDLADGPVRAALSVLDTALSNRQWLVGERFTIADLNVAAVLSPSRVSEIDFGPHRAVQDWLDRCYARPAAIATRRRYSGST